MSGGDVPSDFLDLLQCLREEGCDFVIVGAHALAAVLAEQRDHHDVSDKPL